MGSKFAFSLKHSWARPRSMAGAGLYSLRAPAATGGVYAHGVTIPSAP